MEEEAAKGLPELSKKAHQAFKGLTGATSKQCHDGLGDVATWHTPLVTKQARGHTEVGALVSEYTHTISSTDTSTGEFNANFMERVSAWYGPARQHLLGDEDRQGFNAGRDMVELPSHQEVAHALKTLGSKIHKSPGIDGIYNWMLVLGGDLSTMLSMPCMARYGPLGKPPQGGGS